MAGTRLLKLPVPERARRSQAERTAETRARIIEAVVASIDEVGFQKTTASEITRRAGVTWGAVQHHFGGKDGILAAVLEDSFHRFESRIAEIASDPARTPLERRVSHFVDRAWEHFASPHYRSTFEILLNHAPGESGPQREPAWQTGMFRAWNGVWDRLFGDVELSRGRSAILQHYTISVLSGLASMKAIEGPTARIHDAELAFLKRTLLRELAGDGSDARPSEG